MEEVVIYYGHFGRRLDGEKTVGQAVQRALEEAS